MTTLIILAIGFFLLPVILLFAALAVSSDISQAEDVAELRRWQTVDEQIAATEGRI